MHLHHSTQLVQVQGSAILPDNTHAPIWFVEHFLRQRIMPLASSKAHEVSTVNNLVKKMMDGYSNDNLKQISKFAAKQIDYDLLLL